MAVSPYLTLAAGLVGGGFGGTVLEHYLAQRRQRRDYEHQDRSTQLAAERDRANRQWELDLPRLETIREVASALKNISATQGPMEFIAAVEREGTRIEWALDALNDVELRRLWDKFFDAALSHSQGIDDSESDAIMTASSLNSGSLTGSW